MNPFILLLGLIGAGGAAMKRSNDPFKAKDKDEPAKNKNKDDVVVTDNDHSNDGGLVTGGGDDPVVSDDVVDGSDGNTRIVDGTTTGDDPVIRDADDETPPGDGTDSGANSDAGTPLGDVVSPSPVSEAGPESVEAPAPEPVDEPNVSEYPPYEQTDGASSGSSGTVELKSIGSTGAFSDNLSAPLVLEFTNDIQLGGGLVELQIYDGDRYVTVETLDVNDGSFSVSGNQLSFQPTGELEALREYALKIEPGAIDGAAGEEFNGITEDSPLTFQSGIGVDIPSFDPASYDNVVNGETFNSTVFLDSGDSNTLFINCTFENIDGSGIMMRNVENVTIYNCTFSNIDDFGILLRSSGSTDGVSIMSNTFEDIGGDGIHAAKRHADDVDHTDLLVYDNDLHDIGMKGGSLYHGIYVQSSEAVVWGNEVSGFVDSNGISIRGDGIVYDNYVNITSGRDYGSGIKYYSDHMTGDSKTLIIADNVVEPNNLYSGIQLDMTTSKKPSGMADEDWVVNDFLIMRNDVNARNDYVIDSSLEDASWATVEFVDDAPAGTTSFTLSALPEVSFDDTSLLMDADAEEEIDLFAA